MNKQLTSDQKVYLARQIFENAFQPPFQMNQSDLIDALECVKFNEAYPLSNNSLCSVIVSTVNSGQTAEDILDALRVIAKVIVASYTVAKVENYTILPANKDAWTRYTPSAAVGATIFDYLPAGPIPDLVYFYQYFRPAPYDQTCTICLLGSGDYFTKQGGNGCYGSFEDCVDFLQNPDPCPH